MLGPRIGIPRTAANLCGGLLDEFCDQRIDGAQIRWGWNCRRWCRFFTTGDQQGHDSNEPLPSHGPILASVVPTPCIVAHTAYSRPASP